MPKLLTIAVLWTMAIGAVTLGAPQSAGARIAPQGVSAVVTKPLAAQKRAWFQRTIDRILQGSP